MEGTKTKFMMTNQINNKPTYSKFYKQVIKKIKIKKQTEQSNVRSSRKGTRKGESMEKASNCMVMIIGFNLFDNYYKSDIAYNDV